eukprot:GAFH01001547.1.p2 GENE.GAFH01001547.1~~GAFH01001547.1.p2  ORF type:complete len:441 (-),score=206.89 GAFH01001547.1:236-1513(-)
MDCPLCQKQFSSAKALEQHCMSKAHRDRAAIAGLPANVGIVSAPVPPPGVGINAPVSLQKFIPQVTITKPETVPAAATATASAEGGDDIALQLEKEIREKLPQAPRVDGAEAEEEAEVAHVPERMPLVSKRHCLFCSHQSRSLKKNMEHMIKEHSFQIDEIEFLADLEGLLEYLAAKLTRGCLCFACGRQFTDGYAARKHMIDKAHCYTTYEPEEYGEWYDFSTSYPEGYKGDDEEEEGAAAAAGEQKKTPEGEAGAEPIKKEEEGPAEPAAAAAAPAELDKIEEADEDEEADEEGEEDDDDEEEEGEKPFWVKMDEAQPSDEAVNRPVDIRPSGELVLSNGAQLGTRELARYYRQKFRPPETRKAVLVNAMVAKYRQLGWIKQERSARYRAIAEELKINQAHEDRIQLNQNFVGTQRIRSQLRW